MEQSWRLLVEALRNVNLTALGYPMLYMPDCRA